MDWTINHTPVSELTSAQLFGLIRDAVTQGSLDAQQLRSTGHADMVRKQLDSKILDTRVHAILNG